MINANTLFQDLVTAGMPEKQAEIIINLQGRDYQTFATKEQFDLLGKEQVDIKTDIKIIKNEIANIKEDMPTKHDVIEVKYDILKWMITFLLVAILLKLFLY